MRHQQTVHRSSPEEDRRQALREEPPIAATFFQLVPINFLPGIRNARKVASLDPEIAKTQDNHKKKEQQLISLTSLTFNTDLYGGSDKGSYLTSIPANEDEENIEVMDNEIARKLASYNAPKSLLKEMLGGDNSDNGLGFRKPQKITDREGVYHQRRFKQVILPERHDPFSPGEETPDPSVRTYTDVMREQALKREKEETLKAIARKKKEEEEAAK